MSTIIVNIATIIAKLSIIYGVLAAAAYFFQERLLYFPTRHITATPTDIGLAYESIKLETSDGVKLAGWLIPRKSARGVVLFLHGNAGNISHRLASIETFHRLGLTTLIIDYRGYGQSEGRATELGTYLDAEAAWRHLVAERHIPPRRILIFGRSLGGGVASWLARQQSPGALVLESTCTSIPDVAAQKYPFLPARLLSRIHYSTLERLPAIDCPILIVHSPHDRVIPYTHGQRLFAAANEPKDFLQLRGGHNDGFLVSANEYQVGLDRFISKYLEGAQQEPGIEGDSLPIPVGAESLGQ